MDRSPTADSDGQPPPDSVEGGEGSSATVAPADTSLCVDGDEGPAPVVDATTPAEGDGEADAGSSGRAGGRRRVPRAWAPDRVLAAAVGDEDRPPSFGDLLRHGGALTKEIGKAELAIGRLTVERDVLKRRLEERQRRVAEATAGERGGAAGASSEPEAVGSAGPEAPASAAVVSDRVEADAVESGSDAGRPDSDPAGTNAGPAGRATDPVGPESETAGPAADPIPVVYGGPMSPSGAPIKRADANAVVDAERGARWREPDPGVSPDARDRSRAGRRWVFVALLVAALTLFLIGWWAIGPSFGTPWSGGGAEPTPSGAGG